MSAKRVTCQTCGTKTVIEYGPYMREHHTREGWLCSTYLYRPAAKKQDAEKARANASPWFKAGGK